MKKNIGIIGVGQLGSRHLQGAKSAQLNLNNTTTKYPKITFLKKFIISLLSKK